MTSDRSIRQMAELVLLRDIEKVARGGHQPVNRIPEPDHKWHASDCVICDALTEIDRLRNRAA